MPRAALVLATLALAATGATAQGWEDAFDGPALHSRWRWRTPVTDPQAPTCSLTERPGWLRIHLPQRAGGFDHWNLPKPVDEAPQLRAAVPPGDWEVEARIQIATVPPTTNFHLGLVMGFDDRKLVLWGPFAAPGLPDAAGTPEVILQVTGATGTGAVRRDVRGITLRLTKIGDTCQTAVRRGEGDWDEGGTYRLTQPPTFLGIIGKTFLDGPGITFDVDYVRVIERLPRPAPNPAQ